MGSEREEEEDAPKQRGFQDGVDLHLGAIKQTNARKREREREREEEEEEYQTYLISKRKKRMVRMHEKCMNM